MNERTEKSGPEISVIVPVYKVERFLPACIDSLLAQTFADFELILVDDGSPDGCPVLCDAAAEKDNRVRVLHKANGGVSTARNAGLDMARGKWIAFVDSDDSVQPDYLEKMYTAARAVGADIALCGGQCVDEEGGVIGPGEPRITDEVMGREEALRRLVTPEYQVPWNKLYRRDVLEAHGLRIPQVLFAEDQLFNLEYLHFVRTVVSIPDIGYHYLQNPQSVSHTRVSTADILAVRRRAMQLYRTLCAEAGLSAELRGAVLRSPFGENEFTLPPLDTPQAHFCKL